jgi:hypothetical protein
MASGSWAAGMAKRRKAAFGGNFLNDFLIILHFTRLKEKFFLTFK